MPLTSVLPTPLQSYTKLETKKNFEKTVVAFQRGPPTYGHRQNFVPRKHEDFGDGGSFPEISVAQYPLDLGKAKTQISAKILPITVDAEGKIKYDAIVKQGHHKDKIIKTKYEDLLPKSLDDEEEKFAMPDEEDIEETTEKTRQALEKLVSGKIAAAMPVKAAEKRGPAQFIRYTPSQQNPNFNSGAKQRIIRMVEMPKDPMSPPRFNVNKKIPKAEGSPPAPVLHSPPRKMTVKEQQDWKIPPCISNWKNPKGYTIPLDKRLAADGRGLQEVTINENFAKLAEALYIADRKAREAVEMRAQMERKLAQREKEKKEEHLRLLAQKAREARAGIKQTIAEHLGGAAAGPPGGAKVGEQDTEYLEREQIRQDRHRDRQRDRNLARVAPDRKSKLERERDISEKIALGLPNPAFNKLGGLEDSHFDQRLFNQSQGLDSGFNHDEAYNVYDKPWRDTSTIGQSIYRPTKNADTDTYGEDLEALMQTNRFVPDKQFQGLDSSSAGAGDKDSKTVAPVAKRTGPIQFEKDSKASTAATEDPFNLDKFLGSVKKASGMVGSDSYNMKSGGDLGGSSSKTSSSSKKRGRDDDQPTFGRHGASDKTSSSKKPR